MPGPTAKRRAAKARARQMQYRRVCQAVDIRDGDYDRVTGLLLHGPVHHHHIRPRSLGGQHRTGNVIRVSPETHLAIHAKRIIVTGDADGELTITYQETPNVIF